MNLFRNPKKKSVAQLLEQTEEQHFDDVIEEDDTFEDEDVDTPAELPKAEPSSSFARKQGGNERAKAEPSSKQERQLTEADIFRPTRSNQARPTPSTSSSSSYTQTVTPTAGTTVVGAGVTFKGELYGTEDILVLGRFEGKIHLEGNLQVGERGEVLANIKATNIKIAGKVEGNLVATERMELSSTAKVTGDMVAPRLSMNDGAGFKGRVSMNMNEAQKTFESDLPKAKKKDTGSSDVLSTSNAAKKESSAPVKAVAKSEEASSSGPKVVPTPRKDTSDVVKSKSTPTPNASSNGKHGDTVSSALILGK